MVVLDLLADEETVAWDFTTPLPVVEGLAWEPEGVVDRGAEEDTFVGATGTDPFFPT